MKLNKAEDLTKVELAANIASEKAAQIEKIAKVNLHVRSAYLAALSMILVLLVYIHKRRK